MQHSQAFEMEAGSTFNIDVYSMEERLLCNILIPPTATVREAKMEILKLVPKLKVERQALRLDPKGKNLKNHCTLVKAGLRNCSKLYVKDLGPQVSWKTVFLLEYSGPIVVYALLALRPEIIYGELSSLNYERSGATTLAFLCWMLHYVKRLLETMYVHRFSHATMALKYLFRNCGYYWCFSYVISYHVNHPLYTPPNGILCAVGFVTFVACEFGNLSVHLLLRDLRPEGTSLRQIPRPNANVFTKLFDFVACPNYTYEFGAWLGYSLMTCCLAAFLFACVGLFQMSLWALRKNQAYRKEFKNFPKCKAIIPFIL